MKKDFVMEFFALFCSNSLSNGTNYPSKFFFYMITEVFMLSSNCFEMIIQGVLGLHEFWAREKLVQAKVVLVKLCTSSFVKLRTSDILSTCYPRNGVYLKIRAS